MAYTTEQMALALSLLKTRLNRNDEALDQYLGARLESAHAGLVDVQGINLDLEKTNDLMFLVDLTEWQYKNRDKPGNMPEWLRLQRREIFLSKHAKEANE